MNKAIIIMKVLFSLYKRRKDISIDLLITLSHIICIDNLFD